MKKLLLLLLLLPQLVLAQPSEPFPVRTEDSAHTSGDRGFACWAVRNDSAASRTSADGDYSPFSVDSAGRLGVADLGGSLTVDGTVAVSSVGGTVAATQSGSWTNACTQSGAWSVRITDGTDTADVINLAGSDPLAVAIVDGSGSQITSFGGGTQYTEGDTDSTITGTAAMGEVQDGSDTLQPFQLDDNLWLKTAPQNLSTIETRIQQTQYEVNDGYVWGTGIACQLDDDTTELATEDGMMPPRITEYRAMHVNLRDASGNEITSFDGSHTIAPNGVVAQISLLNNTSTSVLASNTDRRSAWVVNPTSGVVIWCTEDAAAVVGEGAPIFYGGYYAVISQAEIFCIQNSGSTQSANVGEAD